jgi:hypothetical protein
VIDLNDVMVISAVDLEGSLDAPRRGPSVAAPRTPWLRRASVLSTLVAFVTFAVVVLNRSSAMLEPDDYAYRASIVALSHGQILLNKVQYLAPKASLGTSGYAIRSPTTLVE